VHLDAQRVGRDAEPGSQLPTLVDPCAPLELVVAEEQLTRLRPQRVQAAEQAGKRRVLRFETPVPGVTSRHGLGREREHLPPLPLPGLAHHVVRDAQEIAGDIAGLDDLASSQPPADPIEGLVRQRLRRPRAPVAEEAQQALPHRFVALTGAVPVRTEGAQQRLERFPARLRREQTAHTLVNAVGWEIVTSRRVEAFPSGRP